MATIKALSAVPHAVAVSDPQAGWQEWQNSLDVSRKATAESLHAQFSTLDVNDPLDLIKSEVMEDLPQLARFVLPRSLWHAAINGRTEEGSLDEHAGCRGRQRACGRAKTALRLDTHCRAHRDTP